MLELVLSYHKVTANECVNMKKTLSFAMFTSGIVSKLTVHMVNRTDVKEIVKLCQ